MPGAPESVMYLARQNVQSKADCSDQVTGSPPPTDHVGVAYTPLRFRTGAVLLRQMISLSGTGRRRVG